MPFINLIISGILMAATMYCRNNSDLAVAESNPSTQTISGQPASFIRHSSDCLLPETVTTIITSTTTATACTQWATTISTVFVISERTLREVVTAPCASSSDLAEVTPATKTSSSTYTTSKTPSLAANASEVLHGCMSPCEDGDGGHTGEDISSGGGGPNSPCDRAMLETLLVDHLSLITWDMEWGNNALTENLTLARNCFYECSGLVIACCQYGFTDDGKACKFI